MHVAPTCPAATKRSAGTTGIPLASLAELGAKTTQNKAFWTVERQRLVHPSKLSNLLRTYENRWVEVPMLRTMAGEPSCSQAASGHQARLGHGCPTTRFLTDYEYTSCPAPILPSSWVST